MRGPFWAISGGRDQLVEVPEDEEPEDEPALGAGLDGFDSDFEPSDFEPSDFEPDSDFGTDELEPERESVR
jgi:hypothetical protein